MDNKINYPFHIPFLCGDEAAYLQEAIKLGEFSGNGFFTKACEDRLEKITNTEKALLTSSCTHALEMAALLCDIKPGDEVILASYNFVSAGNAFVLRGATLVFIDVDPGTMNMDINLLLHAITPKTKAIVVMHYGGVACQMDELMSIAQKHGIMVIEDAAHCIGAYYKKRHLGTIGHLGTISFHATKNIQCGEGGCLLINDVSLIEKAEIIREKGTNRKAFLEGVVNKYSWVNLGSSYLLNELSAAFLYAQLPYWKTVKQERTKVVSNYKSQLKPVSPFVDMPHLPDHSDSNHHLFYIRCKEKKERTQLQQFLKKRGIATHFHYIPLHSSRAGRQFGHFHGIDNHTTIQSNRLLRLPLFSGMRDVDYITESIKTFFNES